MEGKRLPARFFRTPNAREPARDWLKKLNELDRKAIGFDIKTVEYGWPIGMPTCRPMGQGLYEVRSNLSSGKIARVFFCVHKNQMILLHGFTKKTQKTPKPDLDLALERKKQLEERE